MSGAYGDRDGDAVEVLEAPDVGDCVLDADRDGGGGEYTLGFKFAPVLRVYSMEGRSAGLAVPSQ